VLVSHRSLNNHGAGGGGGVAGMVGGDVVDGVGCGGARVDDDVAHERAVEEGFVSESFVDVVRYVCSEVGLQDSNQATEGCCFTLNTVHECRVSIVASPIILTILGDLKWFSPPITSRRSSPLSPAF
jgi:hypothetical protein